MNFFAYLFLINAIFFNVSAERRKEVNVPEFIAKEVKALEELTSCTLQQLTKYTIYSLWLKEQSSDETVLCVLKFLNTNSADDIAWSVLGASYDQRHMKQRADFCFKQAIKVLGKHTKFIEEWRFIGPFVIGKTEFDGDPLAAYGGVRNVSRFRYDSKAAVTFFSELTTDGTIKWREVKQTQDLEVVRVSPKVDWNDLVSSLGSLAITEWQGWVVGDLVINENDLQLSFQCLGVAKCYIGSKQIVGDLYHRSQFWFPVTLPRGVHSVFIPLRSKVAANFKFSISKMPAFKVLDPSFLPDLYNGFLPENSYLSIPVSNLMTDKWLKINKVKFVDQSHGEVLVPVLVGSVDDIAPGQIKPVIIQLKMETDSKNTKIISACQNIDLTLKVSTSEGTENLKVTLRCRNEGSSFLFTFIDHDGSVQHAAAVEPLGTCKTEACPVVLTLHGTTVPPQNQADSYKRMVNGEFQFGVKAMWLLAPTRHGAHNWEGPGALTAMSAVHALHRMTLTSEWLQVKSDLNKVLFAGHSMGGHGAWLLATHYSDRAVGLISLAGWIKKEEYGDSNLLFRHDVATSHTDPAVKALMEACVGENDVDKHITNLKGIPVLARIGGDDRTVHPFYVRRMVRLLKEAGINVTYTELPNLAHWWWDTKETNDGGCVNDAQIRKFIAQISSSIHSGQSQSCWAKNEDCEKSSGRYLKGNTEQETVILVTVNPALSYGLKGISVLQQIVPLRISKIQISIIEDTLSLRTENVRCLQVKDDVPNRAIDYHSVTNIEIDGSTLGLQMIGFPYIFCITGTSEETGSQWQAVPGLFSQSDSHISRGPHNYGPSRRIAEQEFIIVVGTMGEKATTSLLLQHAVYIANQFFLTSDTLVPIVMDTDLDNSTKETRNLILLGNPQENLLSSQYLDNLHDLKFVESTDKTSAKFKLGDICIYESSRTGILTLSPNGQRKLAMLIMGLSAQGMEDVVNLATPTIPPMARSPFSNLLPDFVITGPDVGYKGPGGFLCLGFWNHIWRFFAPSSSCVCQADFD